MSVTTIPTAGIADTAVSTAKIAFSPGKIGQVLNVVNHTQTSSSSTSF